MPLTYQQRFWLGCGCGLLALTFLILAGGGVVLVWRTRPVRAVEQRPDARTEQEELVRRWIVRNADESVPVEFLEWGPHMTKQEWDALWREAGQATPLRPADGLVRVRFRARFQATALFPMTLQLLPLMPLGPRGPVGPLGPLVGQVLNGDDTRDWVFMIQGRMVVPFFFEEGRDGRDWKHDLREALGQQFPGINTEK
jgi:hypothetical protein